MTTYDGPGPGRKRCPSCKIYVAARTGVCPCGHAFVKRIEATAPAKTVMTPVSVDPGAPVRRKLRIYAAVEACPVPYDGDLPKWEKKVQEYGAERGVEYDACALGLWLKEFVPSLAAWEKLTNKLETAWS